ncbi:GAF and ANTAR domain-containing protein [Brevibacterium yomogidense]|uniref:GAF and ANTAR domain-containing protein n=1 Tax=Brevibacterium yomogidense TaxID=946573 RepID=UPI0018DFC4E1|nr:GAF and ANTAR domain-containing protein [Brevibacterium yomogidense]
MDLTLTQETASEQLLALLSEEYDLVEFLDRFARLSAHGLGGGVEVDCGITLKLAKRSTVVGSGSEQARLMDEVQVGFEEGPCLEAQKTDSSIIIDDVRSDERWPAYMSAVRDRGYRSALAVPLDLKSGAVAAMNFYAAEPCALGPDDVARAQEYAAIASLVLSVAVRVATHADEAEHRRIAMATRTAIDTAVGIVMAQNRCSQSEAFALLRDASSHRNIKLARLAEEVVAAVGGGEALTHFDV